MEVHRQRCQACDSLDVHDLLVREVGEPQTVYVRCASCGELVARYVLCDYYHHGKSVESYLRSHMGGAFESARQIAQTFQEVEMDALAGYERALDRLRELNKEP